MFADHNTYHCLIVLVLFETPSGFAMFGMSGDRLIQPNALQVHAFIPSLFTYVLDCLSLCHRPNFSVFSTNYRKSGQTLAWTIGYPKLLISSYCYSFFFFALLVASLNWVLTTTFTLHFPFYLHWEKKCKHKLSIHFFVCWSTDWKCIFSIMLCWKLFVIV